MQQAKRSPSAKRDPRNGASNVRAVKALASISALDESLRVFASHAAVLARIPSARSSSACNLIDYLALRSTDIRELQDELSELGLSSLGRSEAHTQATIQAVRAVLRTLVGRDASPALPPTGPSFAEGRRLLVENTGALLGPAPDDRRVRIMVTMPSEASEDAQLIEDLLASGMGLMRINCAHDGESEWLRMVEHLTRAKKRLGAGPTPIQAIVDAKDRTDADRQLDAERHPGGRALGPTLGAHHDMTVLTRGEAAIRRRQRPNLATCSTEGPA